MAEREKPMSPIIGADGNIFNILSIASRTLRNSGMADKAEEMHSRVISSGSYEEALCIITEYITPCREEELYEEPEMDSLSQRQ